MLSSLHQASQGTYRTELRVALRGSDEFVTMPSVATTAKARRS